jgi:hypothetical protein
MDELRGSGYDNAILDPGTVTTTSTVDPCDNDATDWVDCARAQANLGSLTVTQTNSLSDQCRGWRDLRPSGGRANVGAGDPEFIRVTLQANWTAANAAEGTHRLAMTSEFSSLALRDSLLPPPPASNTSTGAPIVRTDNPAGPGVIPIAVGGGDATAASNPRPEMVGTKQNATVTGTRFDVLTYNGLTGAAVIQRRVETEAIKCQCRLGAGGTNLPEIYRTSQWPAIWTGRTLRRLHAQAVANATREGKNSGPKPNVEQSPLCQECCRDHFDGTSSTVAEVRIRNAAATMITTTSAGAGWSSSPRTMSTMWSLAASFAWTASGAPPPTSSPGKYGLLATTTVTDQTTGTQKQAKSGVPDATATTNYQTFVKDYLKQIDGTTGTPPTNAQDAVR